MDIERRLYHYGLGAGIPYRTLNALADAVDTTRFSRDLARRRRAAEEISKNSPWADFIPKDRGFALVPPNTLPGTQEVLAGVHEVIADRRITGWKARANNPFYQLERPEDFRNYPAFMDFALSDAMMQIVSGYYGIVPQLKEIGIWLTPPQHKEQFSSQLYHLDKPESRLFKLFLNVESNTADVGPLTLLPSYVSDVVRAKTGYESIYFRGDGRLKDDIVFKHCSRDDQIVLAGEAGSGGFADTSNCFHFGSRCKFGERKMFVVTFQLPHKARNPRTTLFDLVPEPKDEVRRLALSGAVFRTH